MSTVNARPTLSKIVNDPNEKWEGDRLPRLTAAEFKKKKGPLEDPSEVRLSLAEILFGESVIANLDENATIVVKPVNFKGLGMMEREYGSLSAIPGEDKLRSSVRELVKMLTILVNQDLKTADEKTEDEVGQIINGENMDSIVRAVVSATRPTPASGTSLPEASPSDPTGQG